MQNSVGVAYTRQTTRAVVLRVLSFRIFSIFDVDVAMSSPMDGKMANYFDYDFRLSKLFLNIEIG